jgi:type IV pilus assembly protein PilW
MAPAPGSGGDTCLVRTVTAVTASTETTPQILTFGATGKHNQAEFGTAPAFGERDRITLLGEIRWNRYRREGETLVLERPLVGGEPVVLARGVVGLRAQYGVAAAGGTTLQEWTDATGDFAALGAAELGRVRALRLGIVTRSPQREKPNASGECEASLSKPQLFGTQVEPGVDDWRCYRYRVSTVVVPLRNLVLGLK